MTNQALIQSFTDSQPHSEFQDMMGYRIQSIEPGKAILRLEVEGKHLNRTDRVHGGVLMAMIDSVGGYSGVIIDGESEARRAVSLNVSTNFIRPVISGSVRAEGRLTGGGRRIFFARMEMFDNNDALVATGEGAYRYW